MLKMHGDETVEALRGLALPHPHPLIVRLSADKVREDHVRESSDEWWNFAHRMKPLKKDDLRELITDAAMSLGIIAAHSEMTSSQTI